MAKEKKDQELSRRKFVAGALGLTGGVAGLSLLSVVGGVRPVKFYSEVEKPLEPGDTLVYQAGDRKGEPISPKDLKEGEPIYAYPKGKDGVRDQGRAASINSIIVVKLPDAEMVPSIERSHAPENIVALSRLCTHAGCSVLDIKGGVFPCPCHGSTFGMAGEVKSAPALRALPQLPIKIEGEQLLVTQDWLEPVVGTQKDWEERHKKAKQEV